MRDRSPTKFYTRLPVRHSNDMIYHRTILRLNSCRPMVLNGFIFRRLYKRNNIYISPFVVITVAAKLICAENDYLDIDFNKIFLLQHCILKWWFICVKYWHHCVSLYVIYTDVIPKEWRVTLMPFRTLVVMLISVVQHLKTFLLMQYLDWSFGTNCWPLEYFLTILRV